MMTVFEYLQQAHGNPLRGSLGIHSFDMDFLSFCRLLLKLEPKKRVSIAQQNQVKRSLENLFKLNILSFTGDSGQLQPAGIQRFISSLKFPTVKNRTTLRMSLCLDAFRQLHGITPLPLGLLTKAFVNKPPVGNYLMSFLEITKGICSGQNKVHFFYKKRLNEKSTLLELEGFVHHICIIYKDEGTLEDYSLSASTYKYLTLDVKTPSYREIETKLESESLLLLTAKDEDTDEE
jgi:hypothetical protein